jgi:hypothetical protein
LFKARAVEYGTEPGSHGYKTPQADKDRSVDYNHSTFIDCPGLSAPQRFPM